MVKGKVFLVGAGPGDAQLITVKGLECIQTADVILYDRLVNPLLLEHARPEAELIYCGKLPDRHILRQESINQLLVDKGLEGKNVVRLKGGDPSVFGRVGEEAEALARHQIDFEIVPGITSGIAAPAYAGIPVTHREYGSSFAVVTGHDKSKEGKPTIDWSALASGVDTIAFYMGVGNLGYITSQLCLYGRSPKTPVILIQWGTLGRQNVLEGTLETITAKAEEVGFENPAITLVGDIVSIRKKIQWFEKKPLKGRQVLIARTGTNRGKLAEALTKQGAEVFEYPRMQAESLISETSFIKTIEQVARYTNMLFTSPESVEFFFRGLRHYQIDIRSVQATFYAGSVKSKRALEAYGCIANVIDNVNMDVGDWLVIGERDYEKEQRFQYMGDYLAVYKTSAVKQSNETFRRLRQENTLNTVVFPSARAVTNLVETVRAQGEDPSQLLADAAVICMGSRSFVAAKQAGFNVASTSKTPSIADVIDSIQEQVQTNKEREEVEIVIK
ncbi:uroporphyrinogen-III C-methyltransferase [Desertibacillus haloalkaliphilus]|uniref:uroporphyrinogen-III C-methyltransferase n=1 Tax=Desertibacillus haloalkaliphilus TaxID=1328930 RepID=UPI001C25614F|nr:uroporphyrinogen-III C-methyltransferase [Desertibacillus haloalkaliphilus]MBU8907803.1 uroporphyrinogen-III C-methyltransferase [Desertibacillus haloalkaliphilus]